MDLPEYCRELETHLCRKNDGHLIRIVGPSFEMVSRWATDGVPLKVAMRGIDRYFERYYRSGPRRRPVRLDFCEADVLEVFDEWRRATGISMSATAPGPAEGQSPDGRESQAQPAVRRRGPSLPEHLERVLLRLSSLRATGALSDDLDPILDRVSSELDQARRGLRGDERRSAVARLSEIDQALVAAVRAAADPDLLRSIREEAASDLAAFRSTMPPDAFADAVTRAATGLLRQRLGLPVIAFS